MVSFHITQTCKLYKEIKEGLPIEKEAIASLSSSSPITRWRGCHRMCIVGNTVWVAALSSIIILNIHVIRPPPPLLPIVPSLLLLPLLSSSLCVRQH